MRMNFVAPAGTPVESSDISYWLAHQTAPEQILDEFQTKLKQTFNLHHSFFISTGRAAMTLAFQALRQMRNDPARNEIIVPAYTCCSVPASAAKAGLKIRVCDINPETLSYKLDELRNMDFSHVLAITSANLYGLPDELDKIQDIAQQNNVYLLDDAAQCMGGRSKAGYAGAVGTLGLYSLDKGKNITSIQGGILVTNSDELADILHKMTSRLPICPNKSVFIDSLKLLAYAAILRPQLYWITQYLPMLKLGQTIYTTEYPVQQYCSRMAPIAYSQFKRLEKLSLIRRENAEMIKQGLSDLDGISFIQHSEDTIPVYPRLPVLISNPTSRTHITEQLIKHGIGATCSYPLAIVDIPELSALIPETDLNTKGGRQVASQITTLPTHPYMNKNHISTIIKIFKETLE